MADLSSLNGSQGRSALAGNDFPQNRQKATTEADVRITEALAARRARQPNLAAENQALRTLAQQLMDDPVSMLKTLVRIAVNLCQADTAGVSLLETGPNGEPIFRWVAIAGVLEFLEQTSIPTNPSPCGTALQSRQPQLYAHPERYFTCLHHPQFPIVEALVLPLCVNHQPLGTLWIQSHSGAHQFDAEDQRLMTSLAGFTASALHSMNLRQTTEEALHREQATRAALHHSQTRFEALVANVPGMVYRYSPCSEGSHRFTFVNSRSRELLELEPETILQDANAFLQLIHPDDLPSFQTSVAHSVQNFLPWNWSGRIITPSGQLKWIQGTSRAVRTVEGDVWDGLLIDITNHKLAEATLRQSQEFNRQILDSSDDCIKVLDLSGRLLYMSPGGRALLGINDITPFLNCSWGEFWQGADAQAALNAIDTAKAGGVGTFQGYRPTQTGEPKWWENKVTSIKGADGQVERFLCISRDITERKRAESNAEFLANVSQGLIGAVTVGEIVRTVGEHLNRYLNTSICAFVEINQRADEAVIHYDWHQDDVPSLVGVYPLLEFVTDQFLQAAKAGQTIVVRDVATDGRIADHQRYAALKIGSELNVPLIRDGEWKFSLTVFHKKPYNWRTDEIELMRELSARIWNRIERTRAEEALRESEERLRRAIEIETVGVIFFKTNGSITETNDAFLQMSGYSRDDLEQGLVGWDTMTPPEWMPRSLQAIEELISTGYTTPYEKEYIRKDGSRWWALFAASRLHETEGVEFIIDISDRKRAEQALRQSEETSKQQLAEIEAIYTTAPVGLCFVDSDLKFVRINQQLAEINGVSVAAHIGRTLRDILPEMAPQLEPLYRHVIASGEPILNLELHGTNGAQPGIERDWLVSCYPQKAGDGRVLGVNVMVQEISDRKRAELEREHLLARERHYAYQLQGLTTAALAINSALSVEEVLQVITDQAVSIIGAHQSVTSMTINQNWAQAINAVHLSDKYAAWRDYEGKPDGSGIYACLCHLNRPMRMTQAELELHPRWRGFGKEAKNHPPMRGWLAAPLVGRDGHNIGLIQLSDKYEGEFTQADESILVQLAQMASVAVENARLYEAQQQARSAAEASREEAQAANRVKDEFLAVLSHELRSPLNPILGWSTLLQSRKLPEAKMVEALATIQRNAKLQSELIEDLLDVSRILRGKLSLNVGPVNLAATIGAAMETVLLAAQAKSIKIQAVLEPNVGPVSGDSTRLQQVIWNLLSNAVKFTPQGGQVHIGLEQLGAHAQITVSDTGKGIDPDFLPYVFDYFRQADAATTRKFGGLGLGLAIVRHLVELHGGTVSAESPGEGQGATFIIGLPLMSTQPTTLADSTALDPSLDLSRVKVLLVDDDTDTREFTAFLLEQYGASVTAVSSASEALVALTQSKPDVLLSDIGMPDIDGYMLIQQVRTLLPQGGQIKAIALTAYAGEMNQQQAFAAGFQKHISKPIHPGVLVQAISSLVRSS